MIVDYQRGFVFVHVPKTAGQSISLALGGKTEHHATHTPLRHLRELLPTAPPYAFGFMRNPFARMVSLYFFMCQKPFKATDSFDQAEVRRVGFTRWLTEGAFYMQEDGLPPGDAWSINGKAPSDLPPMQRRAQMWWLEGCTFIGQVEQLVDDYQVACRSAGFTAPPLPHINASRHGPYRDCYDRKGIEHIERHFAADLEAGGYDF